MELSHQKLIDIPGITCVRPKGAMYLFPKIDLKQFNFKNDGDFVLSLLEDQRILVVAGGGFNYKHPDHFRIVFLPHLEQLGIAMDKIGLHFENNRKK